MRLLLIEEPTIGIAHALNTGIESMPKAHTSRAWMPTTSAHPERLAKQVAWHRSEHPESRCAGYAHGFRAAR
jgi:hypothetical protein